MFGEKIIFLNKSTTKFIIIGIDPTTFQTTMRICDRMTGSFITLATRERVFAFMSIVEALVNDEKISTDDAEKSGVKVNALSDTVWKITGEFDYLGVSLHKISLVNLLNIKPCIQHELLRRIYSGAYKKYVDKLREDVASLKLYGRLTWDHLHNLLQTSRGVGDEVKYIVVFDLISCRDYFKAIPEYAVFYLENAP